MFPKKIYRPVLTAYFITIKINICYIVFYKYSEYIYEKT